MDPLLPLLALGAGILSFFSPCSVGMLPAYVGMHAASGAGTRGFLASVSAGLRVGTSTTLGFAWTYIMLGMVLSEVIRTINRVLPLLNVAVAGTIILLSLAAFLHLPVPFLSRVFTRGRNLTSALLYGAAYALTSLGCTLPIFLMLVGYATTFSSIAGVIMALVSYSVGFMLMMVSFSTVLIVSRDYLTSRVEPLMLRVRDVGSLLSLAVGVYLLMYQIRYANLFS